MKKKWKHQIYYKKAIRDIQENSALKMGGVTMGMVLILMVMVFNMDAVFANTHTSVLQRTAFPKVRMLNEPASKPCLSYAYKNERRMYISVVQCSP